MKKLVLLPVLMSLLFIAGCQEKPQPDDRLESYIELWNGQNFEKMYSDYLSMNSKETYSTEDFIDRYQKLYADLEVDDLQEIGRASCRERVSTSV